MKKRVFIAMPMPKRARKVLSWIQNELKEEAGKNAVKWVEEENFHQTLVFLGPKTEEEIEKIISIMTELKGSKSLNLSLNKLGFYPDLGRARIVWVGLGKEDEELACYYHRLRMSLQMAGFEFDTRFSSHVSLGRVRRIKTNSIFSYRLINKIQDFLREKEISFKGSKIVLYQSQLRKKGPVYTPIKEIKLKSS